jgi:hypothetical protein
VRYKNKGTAASIPAHDTPHPDAPQRTIAPHPINRQRQSRAPKAGANDRPLRSAAAPRRRFFLSRRNFRPKHPQPNIQKPNHFAHSRTSRYT